MNTLNIPSWSQFGHEITQMPKVEGVARVVAAVLHWTEGIFKVSGAGVETSPKDVHFENYCSQCGCVLDPVNVASRGFFDTCIKCSEK